jgi:hypothetical protein
MLRTNTTPDFAAMQSDGIQALPALKIWGKSYIAMIVEAAADCEAVDMELAQELRALAARFDQLLEADMSRVILRIRQLLIEQLQGGQP